MEAIWLPKLVGQVTPMVDVNVDELDTLGISRRRFEAVQAVDQAYPGKGGRGVSGTPPACGFKGYGIPGLRKLAPG